MKYVIAGDSISVGVGASAPAKSYAAILSADLGQAIESTASSGHMVPDQAAGVYGKNTVAGDKSVIMLGTNDAAQYGSDSAKRGYFIDGLRALSIYLSAQIAAATPGNGVTFTGAWSTNPNAYGSYGSTVTGAKASFNVAGTAVALGFIRQLGNTGCFKVTIDGVVKGTYPMGGDVTSLVGKSWMPCSFIFGGLAAGVHAVEVEIVGSTSGYSTFFHWFSGLVPKAKLSLVNIPHATAYSGTNSTANIDAYNADIASLVTQLSGYGLDVNLADVCSALNASNMADNVHPNDSGHMKIRGVVYTALTGNPAPPIFTATTVYSGSDGNYYVGDGAARKKIVTE